MTTGIGNNTYAFDECSVLHLCEIKVLDSHKAFFGGKSHLRWKNYYHLASAMAKLNSLNMPKFRFVPSENLEKNIIKVALQLLEAQGVNILMLTVVRADIIDQLSDFKEQIEQQFKDITKDNDIGAIQEIFRKNQRMLKKGSSIPGDDDLKIIAGYVRFPSAGQKYLITEDEDFWGYKDIIMNNFRIHVIEEWNCSSI